MKFFWREFQGKLPKEKGSNNKFWIYSSLVVLVKISTFLGKQKYKDLDRVFLFYKFIGSINFLSKLTT